MSNAIALVEKSFAPYLPTFADVLRPIGLPAERIVRTVLIACEKTPKLMDCNRQSLINSAMSGAVLGLEMDGWSGQAFIIPYGATAQFQMGYKGYPTIGARSGTTVKGETVRERDEFDYSDGSKPFVHFKKKPASRADRGKIIGAWATYTAHDRPPYVVFMPIDDILAIKAKSPGARKAESPWNDANGPGFEGMVTKTAVRHGGRFCPIVGIQRAVALEEQQDMGRAAHLRPDGGVVIEGNVYPERAPDGEALPEPARLRWIFGDGVERDFPSIETMVAKVMPGIEAATDLVALSAARQRNASIMAELAAAGHSEQMMALSQAFDRKLGVSHETGGPT